MQPHETLYQKHGIYSGSKVGARMSTTSAAFLRPAHPQLERLTLRWPVFCFGGSQSKGHTHIHSNVHIFIYTYIHTHTFVYAHIHTYRPDPLIFKKVTLFYEIQVRLNNIFPSKNSRNAFLSL